jgi:hypothetical protein
MLQERLDGRLDWVYVADLDISGASGQGEHAVGVWGGAQEHQLATQSTGADAGVHDRAHAGTVHEPELAQVEHNQPRLQLRLAQYSHELRHRRAVQLASYVHPGSVRTAVGPRAN